MKFYQVSTNGTGRDLRVIGAENLDQCLSAIKRHMVTKDVDVLTVNRLYAADVRSMNMRWVSALTGRTEHGADHYQVRLANPHDFDSLKCACGNWWPCGHLEV